MKRFFEWRQCGLADRAAGIRLLPGLSGYSDARSREFDGRVLTALERLPGVQSAAISRHIPLSGSARTPTIAIPG